MSFNSWMDLTELSAYIILQNVTKLPIEFVIALLRVCNRTNSWACPTQSHTHSHTCCLPSSLFPPLSLPLSITLSLCLCLWQVSLLVRPKRRLLFGLFACRCQQRRREQIEKTGREGEKQREKRKKKQNRHRKTSREGRGTGGGTVFVWSHAGWIWQIKCGSSGTGDCAQGGRRVMGKRVWQGVHPLNSCQWKYSKWKWKCWRLIRCDLHQPESPSGFVRPAIPAKREREKRERQEREGKSSWHDTTTDTRYTVSTTLKRGRVEERPRRRLELTFCRQVLWSQTGLGDEAT